MSDNYGHQRKAESLDFATALATGDDLGAVIRSHLYLERELNHFNEARVDPAVLKVFKPRYNQKVRLAVALGLSEHFAAPLLYIGDIQNTFAHELQPQLTLEQTKRLYAILGQQLKDAASQSFERIKANSSDEHFPSSFSSLSPRDQLSVIMVPLWTHLVTEVHFTLHKYETTTPVRDSSFKPERP
jgi:hypothetical protein